MAAFAFHNVVPAIEYIRLNALLADVEEEHAFLLDVIRSMADSPVSALYILDEARSELKAVALRSAISAQVREAGITVGPKLSNWIAALAGPAQGAPAEDSFLEKFPEAFLYRLKWLAVIPLRLEESLVGLLTLGRREKSVFPDAAIAAGERAARLLAAVLERDSLRERLSERKVVERAKGILQQQRGLTEEQAYLTLRGNCTRRRITMAEVAREIIEAHTQRQTARDFRRAEHRQESRT